MSDIQLHEPAPHHVSGKTKRRSAILLIAGLAVVGGGAGVAAMKGYLPNPFVAAKATAGKPEADGDRRPLVKTVKPKREASVPITIEQLATVEPYYQADLRARASGIVKDVVKDIGDEVKRGEVLVEIDVPESEQEVAQKMAMVLQRRQELRVSEAKVKDAKAAADVSAATIKQRLADVTAFEATRDLKKRKLERYRDLAAKGSVVGSVVEEEERDFLASAAAVTAAQANVERARADFAESGSKIEAAEADIDLKKAQIDVAMKEVERAKVVVDFAKVRAPFDGIVVKRNVDPGSFVQNATSGMSEPLVSISRVDLVTVSSRFPDSAAPYLAVGTPAVVHVDDLPGVTIPAKVTRFSPSIQNSDRTMRVEVDLFNGSETEYAEILQGLKAKGPDRHTKSAADPMPERAFPADAANKRRLMPGMAGTIKLSVGGFGESHVLPTTAVYGRSGANYILIVEDGKTRQLPVKVQLNDGKTVRLAIVEKRKDGREVLVELTGREEVVVARQLEVGDGSAVRAGASEW